MKIKVITRSQAKRELIYSVASLYADILKITKSKYSLTIGTIPGLVKADKMNGGVVLVEDRVLFMPIDSRLHIEQLMQTLAHEMVHVKQYAKGQLRVEYTEEGDPYYVWLGKKADPTLCYLESPWELEAFQRERILANKIVQIISKI